MFQNAIFATALQISTMKQLLLFTFFLFSIHFFVKANPVKGSLHGFVRELKTGKPIAGASVYISDARVGVSTNQQGEFTIDNLSDGNHLVEVSHIGYATIAITIEVKGDTHKDFNLLESIVENSTVVVTGVSKATQLKKIPFQVSVMRKQDFLQSSSMNIIENITKIAGVSSLSTGPAISKPLIRGLGYNRVLTINDGVRQEGQQWGDEHGIEIDDESVSKIEILKGPASLVYGSDAMAGVINIITNVPVPKNTVKLNLGSNYQTNNQLRSFNGNFSGNKNGFNWNAYGTYKAAADYKNKYDGYVFNSKFNQQNLGGYVGYNGEKGFSHLLFSSFDLKAGLVEGDRDSLGNFIKAMSGGNETEATNADFKSITPLTPYQRIRHFKLATDNNYKLGDNSLSFNLGFQQNRREEFGNPDNLNERSLFFDLKTVTYASQFHFKEKNGWKHSIGTNGMDQTNTNLGVEQLIPDYHLFDIGFFLFTQKEVKKFNFSGGVRFDNRNIDVKNLMEGSAVKGDAFKKKYANFSGSAGLTFAANKHTNLKFNIARAFRAPSIPELASNGAHEGTIRYEYGNRNLNSEISTQFDAALTVNKEHFSFNLAGYYNHFSNFIYYRKLENVSGSDSLVNVDGNDLTAFTFDQQAANIYGMEITLDIHPHPLDWLHIENSFSYVRGEFTSAMEGSKNLPFIPAPKLLTEFRADFKKLNKTVKNFYAKYEIENNFSQNNAFTAYNTETASKGYVLMNVGVGAEIHNQKNKQIIGIYLSALNIGDLAYQSHLSRLKYAAVNEVTSRQGVFNVGRNFGVKVNVPLSFE